MAPVDLVTVLAAIPDPEIPVITIEDLGVLRGVEIDRNCAVVTITPTYSGCPAMDQIRDDIISAAADLGYDATVNTVFAPAWTSDWLSEDAKARLAEYGIAPPNATVLCPQCAANAVHEVSRFGSTACKALWVCDECGEPFDRFKML